MRGQRAFRGEHEQKIDAKGRVSIPAPFRRVLEAGDPDYTPGPDAVVNLVIVYGDKTQNFLEGYSVEAMARVDERIRAMKHGPRRNFLQRFFNTFALEVTVDQTGRLVLPKRQRDKIGLGDAGAAIFAGTNETFQIWHPDDYAATLQEADEAAFEGLDPDVDPRTLLDMGE